MCQCGVHPRGDATCHFLSQKSRKCKSLKCRSLVSTDVAPHVTFSHLSFLCHVSVWGQPKVTPRVFLPAPPLVATCPPYIFLFLPSDMCQCGGLFEVAPHVFNLLSLFSCHVSVWGHPEVTPHVILFLSYSLATWSMWVHPEVAPHGHPLLPPQPTKFKF